jgi:hypothetical protein
MTTVPSKQIRSWDYDATIIRVDGRGGLSIHMSLTMTVQGRGILQFDKRFLPMAVLLEARLTIRHGRAPLIVYDVFDDLYLSDHWDCFVC